MSQDAAVTARFTGFPPAAFEFYDRLTADNSKAWFAANRATYDDAVRTPMLALLGELRDEFGDGHAYRPYRDVRFSSDKSSYLKDHQGGLVGVEDAVGYYVQVSASGLMIAGGWYAPIGDQLRRFRDVVDSPAGAELPALLRSVEAAGLEIDGNLMATRPRGVPADHPRLDLLRMRRVTASRTWPAGSTWLSTRTALTRVRQGWRALAPLVEWLGEKVGPGEQPPYEA